MKIRDWLVAGANSDGIGFAKVARESLSIAVDEAGKIKFSGAHGSISIQVPEEELKISDLGEYALEATQKFELGVVSAEAGVNRYGEIVWSATVTAPGVVNKALNEIGFDAGITVSGVFDLEAAIRNTEGGKILYQYARGTHDINERCRAQGVC